MRLPASCAVQQIVAMIMSHIQDLARLDRTNFHFRYWEIVHRIQNILRPAPVLYPSPWSACACDACIHETGTKCLILHGR
jgi:hypothetical protein